MSRALVVAVNLIFFLASLHAQSSVQDKLQFDLSQIGFTLNGQQICEDQGRLQDYPARWDSKERCFKVRNSK